MDLNELKKARFNVLKRVYEVSEGLEHRFVNTIAIGTEFGFNKQMVDKITQYLQGESLVIIRGMGGAAVSITHYGIREVEDALSNPDKETEHFPAFNLINIDTMVNSAIQQGSHGSTQSVAYVSKEAKKRITELLDQLQKEISHASIEGKAKEEIDAEIATVQAQMRTERPKNSVVKICMEAVGDIIKGAATGFLASKAPEIVAAILALL